MGKQELQQTFKRRALILQLKDEAYSSGDLVGEEAAKAKIREINAQLQERHYGPINRECERLSNRREKLSDKEKRQLALW